MQDRIICICGESGSGKSTIAELLEKEGYKYINSFTTRKPRYQGERGHVFTTKKQYECNKAQGTIVAETFFDNEYYWTTRGQFNGDCVYVVDVAGVKELKKKMKGTEIVVIYLKSEQHTRWNRMCWRKHKSTDIADIDILERLKHDKEVFEVIPCNYCIDADRPIETVFKDVLEVIREG